MSWEVGIWNEGVGGGCDDGVWMSTDVKNGFSTGLVGVTMVFEWVQMKNGFSTGCLRDTEEEFKEVLKCWEYGTWDWFSCWGWFGGLKCNSSHWSNICWGYGWIEGVAGINSNCCPGSVEPCNSC